MAIMASDPLIARGPALVVEPALSWSAILAGAFVAVAAGILLTFVGQGLGFPLIFAGLATHGDLTAFSPALGAGAVIVQVICGGLAGYLAGRLRHPFVTAHDDEAHFRDTAQGLIAWAVAALASVLLAAFVLLPYAQSATGAAIPVDVQAPADIARAANIANQASLFMGVGMLLSAFIAAVAGRIGGLRADEMHSRRRA
jgi:hypothetical protein